MPCSVTSKASSSRLESSSLSILITTTTWLNLVIRTIMNKFLLGVLGLFMGIISQCSHGHQTFQSSTQQWIQWLLKWDAQYSQLCIIIKVSYEWLLRWSERWWKLTITLKSLKGLAIALDLTKLSVSKLWVDGKLQKLEYEGLSLVCFECGCYGHLRDSCPHNIRNESGQVREDMHADGNNLLQMTTLEDKFETWIQVVRWGRKSNKKENNSVSKKSTSIKGKATTRSRFNMIVQSGTKEMRNNSNILTTSNLGSYNLGKSYEQQKRND